MTHQFTEPRIPSDSAEFFKGATPHQAKKAYAAAKRLAELCFVIALALPVLLTIALVALPILWTLGPPVLVARQRVGKGGHIFSQYKLRTRVKGASKHAPATLLARFLEESCLVELPQLWNVFVGDMSLVGPLPEPPHKNCFYREKLPNYELRQSVRPGITGYAQVYLRSASAEIRLQYDLYYVRHMGAALDLAILRNSVFPGQECHRLS